MMLENENIPKIRFKGFAEPWDRRRLKDMVLYVSSNLTAKDALEKGLYDLYDASSIIGKTNIIPIPSEYISIIKDGAGVGRIRLMPKNTLFIGTMSGLIADRANLKFVYSLLNRFNLGGEFSGSTIPHIYFKDYGNNEYYIPCLEEQKLIGSYFASLDNLITLHQRKYKKLKQIKKSMLEKMFPHEGKNVPEIRFKGFTKPWERRKVQDVADRFDNLRIPVAANLRVHGTTPYYGANGIQDYVDGFTHDGEFVLIAEDGANDLKNYPVKCVNGRIWVNNHAHVLQGKAEIVDNSFLAFAISQSDMESLLVGGGRAKLNAETLMGIEFRLPCLHEQYRIGEFLTRLDALITLHKQKYEKLKQIKKSLLEKMFVQ